MTSIHTSHPFRAAQRCVGAALLAFGGSAWAQQCNYAFTTVPAPAPAAVPSLSMLGLALLAAVAGLLAWRQGKFPGSRFMAITLVAAAAMLANQGGGGLVQKAYAAAVEVILSNPGGESGSVTSANGDEVTFRNTSGVPLRIGSISPAPANCGEGQVIPPGGTCTTVASCPASCPAGTIWDGSSCVDIPEEPACGVNEGTNSESGQCACNAGFARNTLGLCAPADLCANGFQFVNPPGEDQCKP